MQELFKKIDRRETLIKEVRDLEKNWVGIDIGRLERDNRILQKFTFLLQDLIATKGFDAYAKALETKQEIQNILRGDHGSEQRIIETN